MKTWNNPDAVLKRELRHVTPGALKKMVGENTAWTGSSRDDYERNIRGFLKPFPTGFQCPLSFSLMTDPVLAEDGIIYERNSIQKWFDAGFAIQVSPETQETIGTTLVPDPTLKSTIQQWMVNSASPLHMACGKGDIEKVKQLVHKQMSSDILNRLDLDRRTPLEYAAQQKHTEIVSLLLSCDHVIPLNSQDDFATYISGGFTESDFNKEFAKLKKQLRMETVTDKYCGFRKDIARCINRSSEGERDEHDRCIGGFLSGSRYPNELNCLLSYNLMVDPVTAEDGINYERHKIQEWFDAGQTISPITNESIGMTLATNHNLKTKIDQWIAKNISELHMASRLGNVEKVKSLIDADMSAGLINRPDADGKTPLEAAAAHGNSEVVTVLLSCNNILFQHKREIPTQQYVAANNNLSYQCNIEVRGGALHSAVNTGQAEVVAILLDDARVEVNLFSKIDDNTPPALTVAAMNGCVGVVSLMLSHPRVDVNQQGRDTKTALHSAALHGNAVVVRLFLQEGRVDVNKPCALNGITPLNDAVDLGQLDVVRLLISDSRVDINRSDNAKWSPIHTAARHGSETADMMGFTVSAYRESKTKERHAIICLLLADERIVVDTKTDAGYTPLMCSMSFSYVPIEVTMRFLQYGIGLNETSEWLFGPVQINTTKKMALLRHALRCPETSQYSQLITFHLCREQSTVHNSNSGSWLRVFKNCWPNLVADCIENFLLPSKVARVILGQVIESYEKNVNGGDDGKSILYGLCLDWKNVLDEDILLILSIRTIKINKLGPRNIDDGVRRSPMKIAKDLGADVQFLSILRNAGGKCISQQGDFPPVIETLSLTVRDESSHDQTFQLTTATSLQDVLSEYASTRSVNRECLVFRFNQVEIGTNTTCESLMLEDESIIHVVRIPSKKEIELLAACSSGGHEKVKDLLEDGKIDVNCVLQYGGWTPLLLAVEKCDVVIIDLLLNANGIDVNKFKQDGATPLYLSVQKGSTDAVKMLLAAPNIDVHLKFRGKFTPLMKAREENYEGLVTMLLRVESENPCLILRVKDQTNGDETLFKIKKTTKMSKMFAAYAQSKAIALTSLCFLFNGNRIDEFFDATPNSLDLKYEDQIEVRSIY